jgi:hypothetical protein
MHYAWCIIQRKIESAIFFTVDVMKQNVHSTHNMYIIYVERTSMPATLFNLYLCD